MLMKQQLALDRPLTYQIKVPGQLDQSWSEWNEEMLIHFSAEPPITTLEGTFDQAALQGLLRRFYSLDLPVISVQCIDYN
jgi:hypothetical protein